MTPIFCWSSKWLWSYRTTFFVWLWRPPSAGYQSAVWIVQPEFLNVNFSLKWNFKTIWNQHEQKGYIPRNRTHVSFSFLFFFFTFPSSWLLFVISSHISFFKKVSTVCLDSSSGMLLNSIKRCMHGMLAFYFKRSKKDHVIHKFNQVRPNFW